MVIKKEEGVPPSRNELDFSGVIKPGGRVLRISSDGDHRRIFLGTKFDMYIFVWLDLSGI